MVLQIDHYVVLGLASGAGLSKEEIKKAYRSKLVVHDDPAEFLKLFHSYQVLKHPESRKLFDEHLRIQRGREEMVCRRQASSFVKEEDIVESKSKITKEDGPTVAERFKVLKWKREEEVRRRQASSFVKEEDIVDVESKSKITKEDDATVTKRRRMISSFVKEELDIINAESISKIAPKQEENDSKTANSFVKQEEDDMPKAKEAGLLVLWHLRKPFCDYTAQRLYEIFGYFGSVRKVTILNLRTYCEAMIASVRMATKEAAVAAASYPYVLGHQSNPVHAFHNPGPDHEDVYETFARYKEFRRSKGFVW